MRDLFPETLLVARQGERIYTTSRKVAEHFGKLHKHVLRGTEKLIVELADPAFTEPNFGLSYYLDSTGRSLPDVATDDWLAAFVGGARARGLLCGLAGSLREGHIAPLARLAPDYLGFRGALCAGQARAHALDAAAVVGVRQALADAQYLAA